MKIVELLDAIKEFRSKLEEHRKLYNKSLSQHIPRYPIRNIDLLNGQSEWLCRKGGALRSYIQKYDNNWIMVFPVTGQKWDAFDEAISLSSIAQIKGPSIRTVISKLDRIIGLLESKNPNETIENQVVNERSEPVVNRKETDQDIDYAKEFYREKLDELKKPWWKKPSYLSIFVPIFSGILFLIIQHILSHPPSDSDIEISQAAFDSIQRLDSNEIALKDSLNAIIDHHVNEYPVILGTSIPLRSFLYNGGRISGRNFGKIKASVEITLSRCGIDIDGLPVLEISRSLMLQPESIILWSDSKVEIRLTDFDRNEIAELKSSVTLESQFRQKEVSCHLEIITHDKTNSNTYPKFPLHNDCW